MKYGLLLHFSVSFNSDFWCLSELTLRSHRHNGDGLSDWPKVFSLGQSPRRAACQGSPLDQSEPGARTEEGVKRRARLLLTVSPHLNRCQQTTTTSHVVQKPHRRNKSWRFEPEQTEKLAFICVFRSRTSSRQTPVLLPSSRLTPRAARVRPGTLVLGCS